MSAAHPVSTDQLNTNSYNVTLGNWFYYVKLIDGERTYFGPKRFDVGERLPAKFMLMPPQAPDEYEETVWTDVLFMRTLNMNQARRRVEKHVCPLPLDIVERLIVRYSNPDEVIFDPFAGLFTVPYMAVKLGRRGWGNELNPLYWENGVKYCRDAEMQRSMPSLFDDVVTADAYELEAVA